MHSYRREGNVITEAVTTVMDYWLPPKTGRTDSPLEPVRGARPYSQLNASDIGLRCLAPRNVREYILVVLNPDIGGSF